MLGKNEFVLHDIPENYQSDNSLGGQNNSINVDNLNNNSINYQNQPLGMFNNSNNTNTVNITNKKYYRSSASFPPVPTHFFSKNNFQQQVYDNYRVVKESTLYDSTDSYPSEVKVDSFNRINPPMRFSSLPRITNTKLSNSPVIDPRASNSWDEDRTDDVAVKGLNALAYKSSSSLTLFNNNSLINSNNNFDNESDSITDTLALKNDELNDNSFIDDDRTPQEIAIPNFEEDNEEANKETLQLSKNINENIKIIENDIETDEDEYDEDVVIIDDNLSLTPQFKEIEEDEEDKENELNQFYYKNIAETEYLSGISSILDIEDEEEEEEDEESDSSVLEMFLNASNEFSEVHKKEDKDINLLFNYDYEEVDDDDNINNHNETIEEEQESVLVISSDLSDNDYQENIKNEKESINHVNNNDEEKTTNHIDDNQRSNENHEVLNNSSISSNGNNEFSEVVDSNTNTNIKIISNDNSNNEREKNIDSNNKNNKENDIITNENNNVDINKENVLVTNDENNNVDTSKENIITNNENNYTDINEENIVITEENNKENIVSYNENNKESVVIDNENNSASKENSVTNNNYKEYSVINNENNENVVSNNDNGKENSNESIVSNNGNDKEGIISINENDKESIVSNNDNNEFQSNIATLQHFANENSPNDIVSLIENLENQSFVDAITPDQVISQPVNNSEAIVQLSQISSIKSLDINSDPHNINYDGFSLTSNLENSYIEDNSYLIIDNSQSSIISGINRSGSGIKKSNSLVSSNRLNMMGNDIYSHNINNNNMYLFRPNHNNNQQSRDNTNYRSIYNSATSLPVTNVINSKSHKLTNMEKVMIMKENHKFKEANIRYDLIVEFTESTHKCLLCFKSVKPTDKIWNCPECYFAVHLSCIMKWNNENSKENNYCPNCHKVFDYTPNEYYCFCHKIINPVFNEYIIPHSCGNVCGKVRSSCNHPCKDRCHPGPCAPCHELVGYKSCFCGRHTYPFFCSETQNGTRSCGEICGRLLNCGIHHCNKPCHPGSCEDCAELITETCMCGQELRFQICGQKKTYIDKLGRMFTFKNFVPSLNLPFVSCGRPCNRIRNDCHHECGRICHADRCTDQPCTAKCGKIKDCGHPCDRPCGHTEACDAEKCKSICGANRTCCLHKCKAICHSGTPCPEDQPCTEIVVAACECLGLSFEIMCGATKTNPNFLAYIKLECHCQPNTMNQEKDPESYTSQS